MRERWTRWHIFKDVSYDTSKKPEEVKKREDESVVIYPKQPLPHQIARGAKRLLPHELLQRLGRKINLKKLVDKLPTKPL